MSFYDRHVVPRLICLACASPAIMGQRAKVVPLAEGRVLELGVGGGLNLRFYDPVRVSSVTGVDPSEGLRARALSAQSPPGLEVRIETGVAERLPFDDWSFDTVVCTFTLCSVHDHAASIGEARRVLKPGGRLLFCEHGLAPDAGVARWQRRVEPLWRPIAGGCRLTRPIGSALAAAGFALEHVEQGYLSGAPKILGWNEWGCARAR